jgi:hypothetical protein
LTGLLGNEGARRLGVDANVTLAFTVQGEAKVLVRVYEDVVFVVSRGRKVRLPWILRSVDDIGRSNIVANLLLVSFCGGLRPSSLAFEA